MPESFADIAERVAAAAAEVESGTSLEHLAAIRQVRIALDAAEAAAMYEARADGHDWAEIGTALGMSGQAAGKRSRQHHQLVDPRIETATGRPARRGPYRTRR